MSTARSANSPPLKPGFHLLEKFRDRNILFNFFRIATIRINQFYLTAHNSKEIEQKISTTKYFSVSGNPPLELMRQMVSQEILCFPSCGRNVFPAIPVLYSG
jgi:hypothetical protein